MNRSPSHLSSAHEFTVGWDSVPTMEVLNGEPSQNGESAERTSIRTSGWLGDQPRARGHEFVVGWDSVPTMEVLNGEPSQNGESAERTSIRTSGWLGDQPRAPFFLVVVFFLMFGDATTSAADWPTFRADQTRSGYTAEPFPNRLSLRWVHRSRHTPRSAWPRSQRMPFDRVFEPIIVGDLVLFGSSAADSVVAINAVDGTVKWTFLVEGPVRFAPVVWKDRVFATCDDGYLYALSLADGSLLWRFRGGPDDRLILGNDRVISHWPARGGPVVAGDCVYFAAGIWPSDGIYLHALDAQTGKVRWTNDRTGGIEMDQPHPGARAKSGVSPQGYLLTDSERLFVPTGRAVPAVFRCEDGELLYYHLQGNQQRGGTEAALTDRFLLNSGCLFDSKTGEISAKVGIGSVAVTPNGIIRAEGKSLAEYQWRDHELRNDKGELVTGRALEQVRLVDCERQVLKLIVTGSDAVCGEEGRVCAIDYSRQRNTWWSHEVEGRALGLAFGNGRLVVSTDQGCIYCFNDAPSAAEEPFHSEVADVEPRSTPELESHFADIAAEILRQTRNRKGFCVDLGCGDGALMAELAKRTQFHVCGVESDRALVAAARRRLRAAGLYGVRASVLHRDPTNSGLPDQMANLVVSTRSTNQELEPSFEKEIHRIQRPYGGVSFLGAGEQMKLDLRKALAGAGEWTHQNANPANTICSADQLVQGPLEMAWFRDVGFELPNRHGQGPAPLFHAGVMVVGGVDGVCAVDAYNGTKLWEYEIKGNLRDYDGIHHDVSVAETGSNFCLGDHGVFIASGRRCLRLDLATGEKTAEFAVPSRDDKEEHGWGFIAYGNGTVFGTVANRQHKVSPRYRQIDLTTESELLFALDAQTGKLKWHYQPKHSIRNNTITIGGGSVFLIDRPIVTADRITDPRRDGRHRPPIKQEEQPKGILVSLDAATGDILWEQATDIFGTQLAVGEEQGVVLMNFQAVRHSFFLLPSEIGGRLAAFDVSTGKRLWDVKARYQTRPIINGEVIYTQNGAWNLKTGQPVPFTLNRSYGCGQISASADMLLFRSGTLGYLDMSRDAGTENFGGMRPGCWINVIPAGGLVLVPDGSTKCTCSYQMQTWLALRKKH